MAHRPGLVALLLFLSGASALTYQVAWIRDLRLVFGASTAASAAVVAIFMAGLGFGGLLLGAVADRSHRPLALYARLELAVALLATASPWLITLITRLYLASGGSTELGLGNATLLRLALATAVLGVPTFLMGGTLPAAVSAVLSEHDRTRRGVALLYGANTLGAFTGAFGCTFLLLEALGVEATLYLAALVNAGVGGAALLLASGRREPTPEPAAEAPAVAMATPAPAWFVLTAAGMVGFAFFLLELVWYRMLGPILGGSTFTFGLILAVALLGVGAGGALYTRWDAARRPLRLQVFALTCAAEALAVVVPYALGDRIAVLALALHPVTELGFPATLGMWSAVTVLVVLPAAAVAGWQFPLLVSLMGRGRADAGRHVGRVYAANTAGSILGSLAGGFGLIPLLGADGAWSAVALLLAGLALLALVVSADYSPHLLAGPALLAVLAASLALLASGPSAVWRHSGIGAGRAHATSLAPNHRRAWESYVRRTVVWESDGVESSIALRAGEGGLAFLVNGKSDGSSVRDAPTQVMLGLLGALLHPAPRTAFVIGLGTGSTAGWLAAVPTIERVDVAELEPDIVEVARRCSAVNHDVLDDPKVRVLLADGREVLLTSDERYDLVVSEPSNPYRAGIASLYTEEFFRAVEQHLNPNGLLLQWVQAYEIQPQTMKTVYRTLLQVFESVDTWAMGPSDLVLVCSKRPPAVAVGRVRRLARDEPFRSALESTWRTQSLEGVLARHVGGTALARELASHGDAVNRDDHTVIEYQFARAVGSRQQIWLDELRTLARRLGAQRPPIKGGAVDWTRVGEELEAARLFNRQLLASPVQDAGGGPRGACLRAFARGDLAACHAAWRARPWQPANPTELVVLAASLASAGDDATEELLSPLGAVQPIEATSVEALLRFRQGRTEEAARRLAEAFVAYRTDPWPWYGIMKPTIELAVNVAEREPRLADDLARSLQEPFAVHAMENTRTLTLLRLTPYLEPALAAEVVESFEPHPLWGGQELLLRLRAYERSCDPCAADAARDLQAFVEAEPESLAMPERQHATVVVGRGR